MPSTLNPACLLCGLHFGNKPVLDLHIREDRRQRVLRARTVMVTLAALAHLRLG